MIEDAPVMNTIFLARYSEKNDFAALPNKEIFYEDLAGNVFNTICKLTPSLISSWSRSASRTEKNLLNVFFSHCSGRN